MIEPGSANKTDWQNGIPLFWNIFCLFVLLADPRFFIRLENDRSGGSANKMNQQNYTSLFWNIFCLSVLLADPRFFIRLENDRTRGRPTKRIGKTSHHYSGVC